MTPWACLSWMNMHVIVLHSCSIVQDFNAVYFSMFVNFKTLRNETSVGRSRLLEKYLHLYVQAIAKIALNSFLT